MKKSFILVDFISTTEFYNIINDLSNLLYQYSFTANYLLITYNFHKI